MAVAVGSPNGATSLTPGWAGGGCSTRAASPAGQLDFSHSVLEPQQDTRRSAEEWVTFTEAIDLEPNGKLVLRMSVLTYPQVTASFGEESHRGLAERQRRQSGHWSKLSADPERTVTIPIVTMEQNGASSDDYSGVPDSVDVQRRWAYRDDVHLHRDAGHG